MLPRFIHPMTMRLLPILSPRAPRERRPPDGMFDKNSFRCVGINASLGGKNTGSTVCEAMDVDGDKRLSNFSLASDGSLTREIVGGTGKYEGMTMTGTVHPLGPFPVIKAGTFQDCNHQTGTYKLK